MVSRNLEPRSLKNCARMRTTHFGGRSIVQPEIELRLHDRSPRNCIRCAPGAPTFPQSPRESRSLQSIRFISKRTVCALTLRTEKRPARSQSAVLMSEHITSFRRRPSLDRFSLCGKTDATQLLGVQAVVRPLVTRPTTARPPVARPNVGHCASADTAALSSFAPRPNDVTHSSHASVPRSNRDSSEP